MNEGVFGRPLGIYGDAAMTRAFGVSPAKMESIMAAQRETLARWKVSPPRPKANTSRPVAKSEVVEDRAEVLGKQLGKMFNHDARRLADALEVTISYVSPEQLRVIDGEHRWLAGLYVAKSRTAYIANNNGAGFGLYNVLLHELGHAVNLGWTDDRECDRFAEAFLAAEGAGR